MVFLPVRKAVTLDSVTVLCLDMIRKSVLNPFQLRANTTTGILRHLLNSTEKSLTSESNRLSAIQEITPHFIVNPKVYYRVHNSPLTVLIRSQVNSVHASTSQLLKILCINILPSMPRSFNLSLSFTFTHQNPVRTSPLPHTCHMPPPISLSLIWLPEYMVSSTDHKAPRYVVFSIPQSPRPSLLQTASSACVHNFVKINNNNFDSVKVKNQVFCDVTPCRLVNAVGSSIDMFVTCQTSQRREQQNTAEQSP